MRFDALVVCLALVASPAQGERATRLFDGAETGVLLQDFMPVAGSRHVLVRTSGSATIYDVASGRVVLRLPEAAAETELVTLHHGGDHGATTAVLRVEAGESGGRRVTDLVSGQPMATIGADEEPVAVAGGAAGRLLITAGRRMSGGDRVFSIRLWRGDGARVLADFPDPKTSNDDHPGQAKVAVGGDNRHVAVVYGGRGQLASITGGARPVELAMLPGEPIQALALSEDGQRLYVAGRRGAIEVRRIEDLTLLSRVAMPDGPNRFNMVERGRVLEVRGRRETVMVDAATGKNIWAARGSSVNGYRLDWIGGGLVLRGARHRSQPTIHAVYRHVDGDFRQLFRRTRENLDLTTLVASPNARCLLMVAKARASIADARTGLDVAQLAGRPIARAMFTGDGREVVAADETGAVRAMATPASCHSPARP